jgi:putative transposase
MPDYRRLFQPGGTYFFTVVTERRSPWLCDKRARDIFRDAIRRCRARWPFAIDAIVLLPDHLHTIWTLPRGDAAYPRRWAAIKRTFSAGWLAEGGSEQVVSAGRLRQRRRGVFLPRYWEHSIRDELDFERHVDYIHYNPVKHGLVECPREWPYSSFHRYVRAGDYPPDWSCGSLPSPVFDGLNATAME